jgi:purine-binding chemotaxis protein CheW
VSAQDTTVSSTPYLLLDVAGTVCALPQAAVAEVLPLPALGKPAGDGGWLTGFMNLGGRPVPVLDLARFLGLRADPATGGLYDHLVLNRDRDFAWLVDRVVDLAQVPAAAHRGADPAASLNGCVAASLDLGDRAVPVLDPFRLLTRAEEIRLAAQTRAAAERLAALPLAEPA